MKYLKFFEDLHEDSIIQDLKDILLDLEDIGLRVSVSKYKESIYVKISNSDGTFKMSQDIFDVLHRISDYIISNGYRIYINSNYGTLSLYDDKIIAASGVININSYQVFTSIIITILK